MYTDYKLCQKIFEYALSADPNLEIIAFINAYNNQKVNPKLRVNQASAVNHFKINNNWFLVDLPGYGYAFTKIKKVQGEYDMTEYLINEEPNVFVCIIRHST